MWSEFRKNLSLILANTSAIGYGLGLFSKDLNAFLLAIIPTLISSLLILGGKHE
jgi:hypothetical protein